LDVAGVFKLKVDELKNELTKRGHTKTGSKIELQEKLLAALSKDESSIEQYIDESTEDALLNNDTLETTNNKEDDRELGDDDMEERDGLEERDELEDRDDLDDRDDLGLGESMEEEEDDLHDQIEEALNESDNQETSPISTKPITLKRKAPAVVQTTKTWIPNAVSQQSPTKTSPANSPIKSPLEVTQEDAPQPKPSKIVIKSSNEEEKRKNRSERFGETTNEVDKRKNRINRFGEATNEEDKKQVRADRFKAQLSSTSETNGTTTTTTTTAKKSSLGDLTDTQSKTTPLSASDEADRIKKRAERFGPVAPVVLKSAEQGKLSVRKNRFLDEKTKKRQERFGAVTITDLTDIDAKKQARALKFGAT